jgi:biotin carboxyl carrier protein
VKYYVRIGAQALEVEVGGENDGGHVLVDGAEVEAQLVAIPGTPLYHLLLGGESWTVAAQPQERVGWWTLGVVGQRAEVHVVDEGTRRIEAAAAQNSRPAAGAGGAGGDTVAAPMPGRVVRVEVEVGQQVEAGAGLVVVEAMKMENELRAPRTGVVQAVHVSAGQTVERGAPLVSLARAEA